MSADEIRTLTDSILAERSILPAWSYFVLLVIAAAGAYLGSYLAAKGAAKAGFEDSGTLARISEAVKHEFATQLAQGDWKQQMRMAALERRLQSHQEAFALWNNLRSSVYQPNIGEVVMECQDWWMNNCLYLDADSREAFRMAYMMAGGHRHLLDARADIADVRQSWADIVRPGKTLVLGAALPPIKEADIEVSPPKQ